MEEECVHCKASIRFGKCVNCGRAPTCHEPAGAIGQSCGNTLPCERHQHVHSLAATLKRITEEQAELVRGHERVVREMTVRIAELERDRDEQWNKRKAAESEASDLKARLDRLSAEACDALKLLDTPIQMRLPCEGCGELHIDEGVFATKPHHTHSCQHCGLTWRPAVPPTVGVRFLPGFKNDNTKGTP